MQWPYDHLSQAYLRKATSKSLGSHLQEEGDRTNLQVLVGVCDVLTLQWCVKYGTRKSLEGPVHLSHLAQGEAPPCL